MPHRRDELLGPFGMFRRLGLIAAAAVAAMLYVPVGLPLGASALTLLILTALLWKSTEFTNPNLGAYRPGTHPYSVALFFTAYRLRLRDVLSPRIALGLGQPHPDPDHDLQPGWWPATRLSGYWALLAAIGLGAGDILLTPYHYAFWPVQAVPWGVTWFLSALGWLAAIQSALAVRRFQGLNWQAVSSQEPAPATMLSRVGRSSDGSSVPLLGDLLKAFLIGAVPAALLTVLALTVELPPWWPAIAAALLASGFLIIASRSLQRLYLTEWRGREETRQWWQGTLGFLKDRTPSWVTGLELPTVEEWRQAQAARGGGEPEEPDGDEPYRASVKVDTFVFPPNCNYWEYLDVPGRIRGELNAAAIAVAPIGELDREGQEIPGTVGSQGFRIWSTERPPDPLDLVDPEVDRWRQEMTVRTIVLPALAAVRRIGACTLIRTETLTRPKSSKQVLQVTVRPSPGVSVNDFLGAIDTIARNIREGWWVRVYTPHMVSSGAASGDSDPAASGSDNHVVMMIAPVEPSVQDRSWRFKQPPRTVRKIIDIANWSYYYHVNGLSGSSGTPQYVARAAQTPKVTEFTFTLPPGMEYSDVARRLPALRATSGNDFMEAISGDGKIERTDTPDTPADEIQVAASTGFRILAAPVDPLLAAFPFSQYRDQVLLGRQPGEARIDWCPGVMANDTLGHYSWEQGDLPHLLIAGASGMGKSVLVNSMLVQLVSNNSPEDLRLWLIEPKNELQVYQDLDVVDHFVDSWSVDGVQNEEFYGNVADISRRAVTEMQRRYRLMRDHGVKNISAARRKALREGPNPDGTPHPLMMPYIIFGMEECATCFADAITKEERETQAEITWCWSELSRKARASGIFLFAATQYPTNASIPSAIRNNMRRIGLGCQNSMASRVVIDQNGLEEIRTKGVGMIPAKPFGFRRFRGLWMEDGDPDNGERNDVIDVVSQLPSCSSGATSGSRSWVAPDPITVPGPEDAIFAEWHRRCGPVLDEMIDRERETRPAFSA